MNRPFTRARFFSLGIVIRGESSSVSKPPSVPAVLLEEVKPKFVKGAKRYGRRSRPDSQPDDGVAHDSHDSPPSRTEATDSSPGGVRRAKLRRSTSLESVEVRRPLRPHTIFFFSFCCSQSDSLIRNIENSCTHTHTQALSNICLSLPLHVSTWDKVHVL